MYLGDVRLGVTLDFNFTTRKFSTGAPFTLAGSPVISAYVGASLTQLTAGITLNADWDSVTGLNHVTVVLTGGNGYATATDISFVITTGTVDSVSVVGEVIGMCSIENRSALMPTTAARTLDVTATGEAGIDWANVGAPTTTLALTGTTISTSQVVASVSGAVGSVSGNVGGNVVGIGSVTGNVGGNVTGSVGSVVGAVGSVTGNVGGNVVGTVASVVNLSAAQSEPSAVPAANASPLDKLAWLAILARNKITQTATVQIVKADDGTTTVGTSNVSDDGTTATRGEFA